LIDELEGAKRRNKAARRHPNRLAPVDAIEQDGKWQKGRRDREEVPASERK
jgi:hypothetical protein